MKWCLLAAGMSLFAIQGAKADCSQLTEPFDQVYCDIQVFHQADHQLNVDYSDLHKILNPAEQTSLAHGEIAWIKDRDQTCTESQDGYNFVAMDCAVDMTNQRDSFLKDRARECASTGCVDSEIGKEND